MEMVNKTPKAQKRFFLPTHFLTLNRKCLNIIISYDITDTLCFSNVCPLLRYLQHLSNNPQRCTSCDFQVVRFEDARWRPECDYLFFRNWRTNILKLKAVIFFLLSY